MTCEQCNGQGWIPAGDRKAPCSCTLLKRAIDYLTPIYRSAQFAKNFKTAPLDQGDYLFESSLPKFKTIVKSYLLNTGMKYTHRTVSAYDILQAFLTNSGEKEFYALTDVDILILYFVQDPNNKEYSRIINSLLQARALKGKRSWVYTQHSIKSQEFIRLYGQDLANSIEASFKKVV